MNSNKRPLVFVLVFLLLCGSTAVCQQAVRPERGTMPNRAYSLSDIEQISIENGNVHLSIPLASLPPIAGGKLSWTVSANYNSKLWNALRKQADDSMSGSKKKIDLGHTATQLWFGPILNAGRLLGPADEYLELGTARMNLLNAIQNPTLRRLVEYSYRVGAKIGNGSTADAIRFEKETGILLSRTGHIQKGKEVLSSLEKLLASNKLYPKDADIVRYLIDDLKDALSK